ncbi:baseplate J/gp47 family protein [Brevibacillus thermoruber]|uniref:Baseplate J/gp47 family protein n=1 Tax=Brevibacillus thermoruber TaxID=33942 RepID=A0A9X3TSZ0_9BACL|nr:baseplate J/gp47 family protein [Brevibacillus thermoruber]MDA5110324.1 baseplate J/gp47 family protein [Brevibacillus thermoruber]
MVAMTKPDMPILREHPDEIYQRMVNRLSALAAARGETPPSTEMGDLFYDLLYPLAEEIAEQQQLLEYAFLQGFLPWADGEFLDAHGAFLGLERNGNEPDELYRERLLNRARTEEGDGRRIDYERWARDVAGVGGAIAIEKARHDLSIDVYITDQNGQPGSAELAQQVRTKLEEKRKALHDLQVLPADVFPVTVSVRLLLRPDAVADTVTAQITANIQSYLKGRSRLVYQQIGALFLVDGVDDFADYTLNGGTANVTVPVNAVATLDLVVTT